MIPLQFMIQRRIVTLPQSAPVSHAAKVMCKDEVGCILVTGGRGQLVGIVTDRDVACSVVAETRDMEVPLSEVMTEHPLCVEATDDIEHVVHLMGESGIRRIPVIERRGGEPFCIGLVSLDDLIASKLIAYDHLARIIRTQIRRLNAQPSRSTLSQPLGAISYQPHRRSRHRPSATYSLPLNRFYREIREKTGLVDPDLGEVSAEILAAITRRLQFSGAAHLINQLPEPLQDRLLNLPPGPDERVSFETLVDTLRQRHSFSEDRSGRVIRSFFQALGSLLPHAEIRYLRSALPTDFARFFPPEDSEPTDKAA